MTARAERPDPRRVHPLVWLVAGAVLLRLLLFLGRGSYIAFDEGWYLLLGRNLWAGDGYSLSGLRHLTLSPLFPIVAGGLGLIIGDVVWAGRIVAAVAGGLLVIPCWYLFHRLAGRSVALIGCVFVALMPSLAPFVVPYWIGWDLWVGAGPLLHLFLFSGFALFVRAWQDGGRAAALGCGACFALAYLARPEAIIAFGLLAVLAALFGMRTMRTHAPQFVLCALAFALVATPYWLYLRDGLGRWAISGRGVDIAAPVLASSAGGSSGAERIEGMLWQDDEARYVGTLFSLDAAGTRLVNSYWGVRPDSDVARARTAPEAGSASPTGPAPDRSPTAAAPPSPPAAGDAGGGFDRLLRYGRAMGVIVPWFVWPFVLLGLLMRESERHWRLELLVAGPIVGTSLLVALMVAIDPRTQLFVVPVASFYAARGAVAAGHALHAKVAGEMRRSFTTGLVAGTIALLLLGISARRLYLSLAVGSPHHIVAAENAAAGEVLRQSTPAEAEIASWHPAIALFARRDWRVLPLEPMDRIIRYAGAQGIDYLVLSVFYPPPILRGDDAPHYLVVPVPRSIVEAEQWQIQVTHGRPPVAFGQLRPGRAAADAAVDPPAPGSAVD